MSLSIVIELDAATPAYEQIREQLAGYILTGALPLGDHLPTVRALAADLGVAINTVGKAYQALELDGLVHSRRRTGTVVVYKGASPDLSAIRDIAELLVDRSAAIGLGDETVIALVREAIARRAPDPAAI
jgi:GntR family transcriptional regulator